MWSPFTPLLSIAAGIIGNFQQPFNTSQGGIVALSNSQFAEFTPYIEFARAAYCAPNKIAGWQCGDACHALPGFVPTLTGGDGDGTQFFYVGFWPAQSMVVVAHQGTNPSDLLAVLTDIHFHFVKPNPTLFPRIPSDARIHSGFALEHEKTAYKILAEVKRLMAEHSSTQVAIIGHSLGGALAELDTLSIKLNLPAGTTVRGVTFGKPRVGDAAWATFFDSQVSEFTRINNKRDIVPIVPGRLLGFRHPHGEIHIEPDGSVVACSGADDGTDPQCSDKLVGNIENGSIADHSGPYNGILIGTESCTP
ncbi:alpha/beta-hydrolase [Multifurca ochricompacta]|uniref:Alpha/beta-hydrolase n=1 Tax=Multifurca ochricompacta TaxID=376703 RepID=A0AAD4M4P8_9AGAM|nr:alpha/beta-hydrolase [Multifurca ochricompacta]